MSKKRVTSMMKLLLLTAGVILAISCGSNGDGDGGGAETEPNENQVSLTPPDFPLVQIIEEKNKN